MRDVKIISSWLRSLNGPEFLAMPPPDRNRYPQDEAHEQARETLAERGLPPSTPYITWHRQQHRFREGMLATPQPIYWGGDRTAVTERLHTVPEPFAIRDAQSDSQVFVLVRTPDLTVPLENEQTVSDQVHWTAAHLDGELPLTTGEVDFLRRVVHAPHLAAARGAALAKLVDGDRERLDDIDAVLADWRVATTEDPHAGSTALVLASALVRHRHPAVADVLGALTRDGVDTSAVLVTWDTPEALDLVEELGFTSPNADRAYRHFGHEKRVRRYLELAPRVRGTTVLTEALALFARFTAAAADGEEEYRELAQAVALVAPRVIPGEPLPTALDLLRNRDLDEEFRRALVAAYQDTPDRVASLLAQPRSGLDSVEHRSGMAPEEARVWVTEWREAVEQLDRESGRSTFTMRLDSAYDLKDALLVHDELTPALEDWCHDRLRDTGATKHELGFALERLVDSSRFTAADAEALLPRWRKTLVFRPDRLSVVRHPVVSFAVGLRSIGHTATNDVYADIGRLKQNWASGVKTLLLGWFGEPSDLAALWERARTLRQADVDRNAITAYVLLAARTHAQSVEEVAEAAFLGLVDTPVPPYLPAAFVRTALSIRDPQRPWWGLPDASDRRYVEQALQLAEDRVRHPRVRRAALDEAARSDLVERPHRMRPVAATAEESAAARARLDRARAELDAMATG